jgi:thiol-disulfide isomerase/thioredoxin
MTYQKTTIALKPSLIIIIWFCMIALPYYAGAQTREVLTGHKMPDVTMKEMVNYKSSTAQLSDFKRKLVILDFWATYCAPCIAMFPKTDSLEKLFKGKIQFLGVTKEPANKVIAFLKNMEKFRHIKPVSVVDDTLLSKLIYYTSIPYYVWIDENGKLIATTDADEITAKNIESVLSGKPTSFAQRNDIRKRKMDIVKKSLFVLSDNFIQKDSSAKREEVSRSDIFSYSVATKYIENAFNGQLVFNMNHFAVYNVTTDFLYRFFYDVGYYDKPIQGAFDSYSKYVFDIKNPKLLERITIPADKAYTQAGSGEMLDWARKNAVCYEIVYPPGLTWQEKMQLVKEDLDRYFAKPMGFKTYVDKRVDSNTNVLRSINNIPPLVMTVGGNAEEHHDRYSYTQRNMPLSHFLGLLNGYFFQDKKTSFIDKTGVTARVDLQLTCDMTKLESINEALGKYGLKFFTEPTAIDVLVFSDAKN